MKDYKSSRLLVIILIVLDLIIVWVSIRYYVIENVRFRKDTARQFMSIIELKVSQIVDWRHERLSDARYLSKNQEIVQSFKNLSQDTSDVHFKSMLRNNLNAMFLNGKYEAMLALNRHGDCFLKIPEHATVDKCEATNRLSDTLGSGPVIMSDLYFKADNIAGMEITVPIRDFGTPDSALVGWILLHINPEKDFYKFLQAVPIPSKSLEVLLAKKNQDKILFLNPSKSPGEPGDSILMNRFHLPFLADTAILGFTGYFEGIDQRGRTVVGAIWPVKESRWYLIVKMDKTEAYAELRKIRLGIATISLLLIVALTSSISLFWLRQQGEMKILEQDVKMISERYDMLSRYANDAILLYNTNLEIVQINDIVSEKYGYTREELIGMSVERFRSTKTRENLKDKLAEIITSGGQQFETVHQRKDGTEFPVEVSTRFVETLGKSYFQSIIRDITERKQIEQALLASEERLRMITNSLSQIVWTAKPDGKIDFMNPRFEALTGRFPYKGSAIREVVHADDLERVSGEWGKAIRNKCPLQFECRLRMKDGSYRWFLNMNIPLHDDRGSIIKWFGSATDIDDLKRTEKEILILNAELEDRVSQRTAELEAFTFSVSHDLRAPLRAIKGFSQMLLDQYSNKLDPEGQKLLITLSDNAHRMGLLIENLLRLSRASRQELTFSRINMQELFTSLIEETKNAFSQHRIDVTMSNLPDVVGDLALMKQVISNLLSNAVKFSSRQAVVQIEIGSGIEKKEVMYYVKDNGTGFDMDLYPRLFGVFQRLHNMEEFEGTGVGLALAKRIMDKHGGRIWAESEPGHGAVFFFTLPGLPDEGR
jgi:PAS domain S-box-containing protein